MSVKDDGGLAFPARNTPEHSPGMSLRDWFAGQALAGAAGGGAGLQMEPVVDDAYRFADMMLERRKR